MSDAGFLMMKFAGFAGRGVCVVDGKIAMAFMTDEHSIDVTMTEDQARDLGEKLLEAARAISQT